MDGAEHKETWYLVNGAEQMETWYLMDGAEHKQTWYLVNGTEQNKMRVLFAGDNCDGVGRVKVCACHRPSRYVPYKGTFVPYDGTYGAPD